MGWRHDIYYKLIARTSEGTTHDAMALINEHLTLDETSHVTIKPTLYVKPRVDAQPDYIDFFGQRGAVVIIDFTTQHRHGWKSVVYESAADWINAETHDVRLFSMAGDNELAVVYGLDDYKQHLPELDPPMPGDQIVAMLKARAAAAKEAQQ